MADVLASPATAGATRQCLCGGWTRFSICQYCGTPDADEVAAVAAAAHAAVDPSAEAEAGGQHDLFDASAFDLAPLAAANVDDDSADVADAPVPAFETAAYRSPFETAEYDVPAFEAPAYDVPAFEAPAYDVPAFEASAYDVPAFEASAYDATVEAAAHASPASVSWTDAGPADLGPAFPDPDPGPSWIAAVDEPPASFLASVPVAFEDVPVPFEDQAFEDQAFEDQAFEDQAFRPAPEPQAFRPAPEPQDPTATFTAVPAPGEFESVPFESVPFESVPFESVPFESVPFESVPFVTGPSWPAGVTVADTAVAAPPDPSDPAATQGTSEVPAVLGFGPDLPGRGLPLGEEAVPREEAVAAEGFAWPEPLPTESAPAVEQFDPSGQVQGPSEPFPLPAAPDSAARVEIDDPAATAPEPAPMPGLTDAAEGPALTSWLAGFPAPGPDLANGWSLPEPEADFQDPFEWPAVSNLVPGGAFASDVDAEVRGGTDSDVAAAFDIGLETKFPAASAGDTTPLTATDPTPFAAGTTSPLPATDEFGLAPAPFTPTALDPFTATDPEPFTATDDFGLAPAPGRLPEPPVHEPQPATAFEGPHLAGTDLAGTDLAGPALPALALPGPIVAAPSLDAQVGTASLTLTDTRATDAGEPITQPVPFWRRMRRRHLALGLGLAVALGGGAYVWTGQGAQASSSPSAVAPLPVPRVAPDTLLAGHVPSWLRQVGAIVREPVTAVRPADIAGRSLTGATRVSGLRARTASGTTFWASVYHFVDAAHAQAFAASPPSGGWTLRPSTTAGLVTVTGAQGAVVTTSVGAAAIAVHTPDPKAAFEAVAWATALRG